MGKEIMEQNEIFEILGQATLKSVEGILNWSKALLYIERQEKSVGFKSSYIDEKGQEIEVDTEADYFTSKAVQNLYNITSNHPLQHKNWNKARFEITSNGKFHIEYKWDQEWQDEIDRYDKEGC